MLQIKAALRDGLWKTFAIPENVLARTVLFLEKHAVIAPCKGIRIPESGKFLHLESGILEIFVWGIRNTGVGIRNPTNNSNPESKLH